MHHRAAPLNASRYVPISQVYFGLAVLLLIGAAVLMGSLLAPRGTSVVSAVWWISLLALLFGLAIALKDISWLKRELAALRDLDVDNALDQAVQYSGSLAADRARYIASLRERDAGAPQDLRGHLRQQAIASSAHVGGGTRFLSSTLLLLAVLGTFAGMKSALPELIGRIKDAGAEVSSAALDGGTGNSFIDIGSALNPVADAFGANFLALLGALSLGLAAFGATSERRALLLRLDRFSEFRLYPRLPAGASADALLQAVEEMRHHVDAVSRVGDGIDGLRTGIGTFEKTLSEAIEGLRSSFTHSLRQQATDLQAQMNQTVGRVVVSMQEVSGALASTAVSYEGLVVGLRERDLGVQRASEGLERIGQEVSEAMKQASAELEESAHHAVKVQEALSAHARQAREHAESLHASTTTISHTIARHTNAIDALPDRIEIAVERRVGEVTAALKAHQGETAQHLNTIVQAVQASGGIPESVRQQLVGLSSLPGRLDAMAAQLAALAGELAGTVKRNREEERQLQESWADRLTTQLSAIQLDIAAVEERLVPSSRPTPGVGTAATTEERKAILTGIATVEDSINKLGIAVTASQNSHWFSRFGRSNISIEQELDEVRRKVTQLRFLVVAAVEPAGRDHSSVREGKLPVGAQAEIAR